MTKPKKYIGCIYWTYPEFGTKKAQIDRAIIIDTNFNFDWKIIEDKLTGIVKLTTKDNINFIGQHNYVDDCNTIIGKVSARLYTNNNGCLLIGEWNEPGDHSIWIAELNNVKKFGDEK